MKEKKGFGCFTYPTILLLSIIGGIMLSAPTSISFRFTFLFFLFLFSWGVGRMINHDRFSQRYLFYSIFITLCLLGIRYAITTDHTVWDQKYTLAEGITKEQFFENGDSITILSQHRNWKDNYGNPYQGHFKIRAKDYQESKEMYWHDWKEKGWHSWGDLYQYLATEDAPRLDLILKELSIIRTSNKLNKFEFAEMVVTFIQDIPYSFVFETDCDIQKKSNEQTMRILQKCPDCCIGFIPNGVQNPVAFMGDLKGDCDTRTVIIYAILDYFGYDVAILNSNYYKHSILGLHIPASGTYKNYKGKRYYVWETTNTNFTIGTLPKNHSNMNYWEIVTTN